MSLVIRSLPENMRYENGPIVADGDYVFVQGRFSNIGTPGALITVDIVRMENRKVAEHWDVWQDEATKASSKSGLRMFGDRGSSARCGARLPKTDCSVSSAIG